jgi:hypothetical protein
MFGHFMALSHYLPIAFSAMSASFAATV